MSEVNQLGGVFNIDESSVDAAKLVNLVTLPDKVRGANCGNCSSYSKQDGGVRFCTNALVKQEVSARMHCSLWEHNKSIKIWKFYGK